MAPPTTCESAVSPYFHGCLAFLHRHFPPQSPPSHPLDLCLCSQQQLSPGDGSTFPKLQLQLLRLPGDLRPCLGVCMYSCGKDSLILIPFRLPQISCFTLSFKCFYSDSDNHPHVGIWIPASVPPPAKGRSSPTNTPVLPHTSFVLQVLCQVLLVRYSCLLSTGVLHALMCLKLYS